MTRCAAAYIAGKFTSDQEWEILRNTRNALYWGSQLAAMGFRPIVPHSAVEPDATWEGAMERCYALIKSLVPGKDMLVLIPGWENSRGACAERDYAMKLGLEVVEAVNLATQRVAV